MGSREPGDPLLYTPLDFWIGGENLINIGFLLCLHQTGKFNMEQNDTGCQAPVLCVNNCGFFGTAATMTMYSKCYKDMIFKQEQANFAASSIESFVNGSSSACVKAVDVAVTMQGGPAESLVIPTQVATPVESVQVEKAKEGPNRCSTCRRRVGLQALPGSYKI
ncbi:hypothetical protein KY289_016271 [Solanum tuberosum]|nr:hypothetical protein KY289_016271 [Solanum tuberosum]